MDEARAEALSERLFTEMVGGMSLLVEYVGHRLALFKEMPKADPSLFRNLPGAPGRRNAT